MATSPYSPAEAALMQQGLQANLPQTYPYIQRSQYLADALQKLSGESQTIRSPGALAANLGSELLLQLGRKRADKQLLAATLAARQQQANTAEGLLGSDPSPADASTGGQAPPIPQQTPVPPPPQQPTNAGPQPDYGAIAKSRDLLARLLIGEVGGNAAGQKAVASTVMNRAQQSGLSPDQVVNAPHQFEPMNNPATRARLMALDPNGPQMQQAGANVDSVLNNGPTTNADHFWSPQAQAALGRQPPAWAAPGQNIGGNVFTHAGYQAPSNPPPMMQTQPNPQPGAAAPPVPAPSGPMGAPPMPPPGMGGASPPQGPQQFMNHGAPATVQQRALVHTLLSNPATFQQGLALAQKLAEASAAHPEVGQAGVFYGSDGQPHSINQVQTTQQGPAGGIQQNMLSGENKPFSNPNVGAVAPNSVASFGANGQPQVTPMSGSQERPLTQQEIQQRGLPPGFAGTINPLTGEIKAQEQGYGPTQILALQERVAKHPDYLAAQESSKAYQAMVGLAQQPQGGMRAYALRDTFARVINPGAVARVGTIQAIKESQGIPENIKSFLLNIQGDGDVSPAVVQQIIDAAQPFAQSQWQAANALNQANVDFAQRHNIDPRDVMAPLPAQPQRFMVQPPKPQTPAPGQPGGFRVIGVRP